MTGKSENIEAAERYLARGDASTEGLRKAASARLPSRSSWREGLLELAKSCGQRGREWLAGLGRRRSAARPRLLSVAERLDLGPKKALLIVDCGERRFLVASGAEAITAMLEVGSTGSLSQDRVPVIVPARWSAD